MPLNQVGHGQRAGAAHDHRPGLGPGPGHGRSRRRSAMPVSASIPQSDGQLVRVPIPELSQERRKELTKIAHKYAEQARVAVRNVRRDGMELLKKLEKDGKITEDEHRQPGRRGAEADRRPHQEDRRGAWRRRRRKSCRSEAMEALPASAEPEAARACRHHHGRQWPLGEGARAAAGRRPQARGRGGPPHRHRRGRARDPLPDPLWLLLGELEAPGGRDRRSHGPAAALSQQRDRGAGPQGRQAARHRRSEAACSPISCG